MTEGRRDWPEVMDDLAMYGSYLLGYSLGHRPPGPRSESLNEAVEKFKQAAHESHRLCAAARYPEERE